MKLCWEAMGGAPGSCVRGPLTLCADEAAVYARGFPVFLFKLKFPNYCLGSSEYKSFNKNRVVIS